MSPALQSAEAERRPGPEDTAGTPPEEKAGSLGLLKIILGLGGIQGLTVVVNLLRSKMMAVLIGPLGLGIVSIIDQIIVTVAQISAFSIPVAGTKYLSRSHSIGPARFARTYWAFLKALLLLSVSGTAVAMAVVVLQPTLLGQELLPYRKLLLVALAIAPTMPLLGYLASTFAALRKLKVAAAVTLIADSFNTIAVYVGITVAGILGLYCGRLITSFVVVAGILLYTSRLFGTFRARGAKVVEEIRRSPELVKFCGVMYVTSFTGPVAYLIARIVLARHSGLEATGLFQSAFGVASVVSLILGRSLQVYLAPLVNQNIDGSTKIQKSLEFQRSLALVSVMCVPVVLFPREVMMLLFSSSFSGAGQYLFVFVLLECILLQAGVYRALLVGFDQIRIFLRIALGSELLLALLIWVWVPRYGIWGIAGSVLVVRVGLLFLMAAVLKRKHGLAVPLDVKVPVSYSLVGLAALGFWCSSSEGLDWQGALLRVAAGLLFIGAVWFLLNERERASLRRLWRKAVWAVAKV